MNKSLVGGLILAAAVFVAMPSVAQAYYGQVGLKTEGSSVVKVGESSSMKLILETGDNKVVGMYSEFDYDSSLVEIKDVVADSEYFQTHVKAEAVNGKLIFSLLVPTGAPSATGNIEVGSFTVVGKKEGSANLALNKYSVGGINPAAAPTNPNEPGLDSNLSVNYPGKVLTVDAQSGDTGILNFKMAFTGVSSKSKCATNWTVKAMVKDNSGNSKTYENVPLELVDSNTEKNIYKGSVVLSGMSSKSGLSLFLKGPKHIQVKYGVNNQGEMFAETNGKLSVTSDPSTSTVYNFSGYTMDPGDVNQDGLVNAQDFAIVKTKSISHEVVEEGTYLREDLDGNCIMNTSDALLLRETLKDKQDQIY